MAQRAQQLDKLLSRQMSQAEERELIQKLAKTDPEALPPFCSLLSSQKAQIRRELEKSREACNEAIARLDQEKQAPWYPGEVLAVRADGRVDLVVGGRRQIVAAKEEVEVSTLRVGDEVFLDPHLASVVARNENPLQTGLVGTVTDVDGGRVVLRGVADDQLVALCRPDLVGSLSLGDRVLYRPDTHCVIALLPQRRKSPYELERLPEITFADIGGLEEVIAQIRCELDPHLRHPQLAHEYRLQMIRGLVLVGPPGVGKTLLATATARHIAESRPGTQLLHIKPGSLRGTYYGQTEQRIRELFASARQTPGLAVIFLDELDNFGTRGIGIGQDIDGRVMGALLSELDGLGAAGNVFCISATNRLDLCDEALIRSGRLGGKIFQVGRPDRQAADEIFSKYLTPSLPYTGTATHRSLIDAALGYLYAPTPGAGSVATVTLANGDRREVKPAEVMSGAIIAGAVERSKHAAVNRALRRGTGGLSADDLLEALDESLAAEGDKLRSPHAAARLLDFPAASEIVRIEVPADRHLRRHSYLRAV